MTILHIEWSFLGMRDKLVCVGLHYTENLLGSTGLVRAAPFSRVLTKSH